MSALTPFRSLTRSNRSIAGSRNGVALLVVLAFVILLSILVTSFLSFSGLDRLSTASYSKSIQAQEIAQGGLQDIIADLHQEIVAGSINPTSATYTQGSTTIYIPTNNFTAQPLRLGYALSSWGTDISTSTFPPTLVRVSRASGDGTLTDFNPPLTTTTATYYQGGTLPVNRASAAHSDTPSVNGRYISPTVWNKPGLLAAPGQALPLDFTANGAAPDWVYVTRAGSGAFSSTAGLSPSSNVNTVPTPTAGQPFPASPVTGRYAYVIYDEGALLDANVAGYPEVAATTTASYTPTSASALPNSQVVRGKSYTSYADLTQLPGMTQGVVDSFVNFRDAGGISYASASGTGTAPFLGAVFNYAQNGFLQFLSSGGANSVSDSPLLNRQDLINYMAKIDPTNAGAAKALPYLGTYSRAVSAPTYAPPLDPVSIPRYKSKYVTASPAPTYHTSMEIPGISNRDLANVRFYSPGTVLHYLDNATTVNPDGSTSSYTVEKGEPLLQNRFSLARIGWLSDRLIGGLDTNGANPNINHGPSSQFAKAIQSCFGLVWGVVGPVANGGNGCWKYTGSTGGTAVGAIETLDLVAKENREPNFFELLKASILSGSLGLSPGPAGWNNGGAPPYDFRIGYSSGASLLDAYSFDRAESGTTPKYPAPAGFPDVQIIKIGANIIDQYDADSYPTAIYFPYSGLSSQGLSATHIPGSNYDAAQFTTYDNGGEGDLGPTDIIYGDENLPCITGVFAIAGTDTATDTTNLQAFWQPQLWNPHQEPVTADLTNLQQKSIPSNYTVRAYGKTFLFWFQTGGYPNGTAVTSDNTQAVQLDDDFINISDSNPATSAFFPTPLVLTSNIPSPSGFSTILATVDPSSPHKSLMTADPAMANYKSNEIVGFPLGNIDGTYIALDAPYEVQGKSQFSNSVTFCLGWNDQNGGFHPYSYIPQIVGFSYQVLGNEKNDTEHGSADPRDPNPSGGGGDAEAHIIIDPRTTRLGDLSSWGAFTFDSTIYPSNNGPSSDNSGQGRPSSAGFFYGGSGPSYYEIAWDGNATIPYYLAGFPSPCYYADPDGVVRPGDAYYADKTTGDGLMTFISNGAPSSSNQPASDSGANSQHGRRPIILNRPFRSVGELGYVFRDLPFKTLDLFSGSSADAALLDVFSLTDESKVSNSILGSVVSGQVNINNSALPVLEALLSGGEKKDSDPTYNINLTDAATSGHLQLAQNIAANLALPNGVNPIVNRAGLVTQVMEGTSSPSAPAVQSIVNYIISSSFANTSDESNKAYLEAPVRALSNANTRTWNLLIDLIAQSGQLSSTATSLDQFSVQGERRYWLHIAIDRYTGKVVSQQLEPVYE